jgi:menaquinone-dependent protoporphyrinogen oxidase
MTEIRDEQSSGGSRYDDRTDEVIALAVRRAFVNDVAVPDESIRPSVSDGIVVLQGTVTCAVEREEAERIAGSVTGVRGVRNEIAVWPQDLQSSVIWETIREALQQRTDEKRRVAVLYATREGQTRKIAEHVADVFRSRDFQVDVRNVAEGPELADIREYAAVVLAASLHAGHHEREMERFVREHRDELDRVPAVFFSVSLSEAGAEDTSRPLDERARFARDVASAIDVFLTSTGWHPAYVKPVAGALVYTRYNPLVRFIMKRIAKKVGASTDTSRDHEYTDWSAIDRFVTEVAVDLVGQPG